jgi:glutamate--cysteine ligase
MRDILADYSAPFLGQPLHAPGFDAVVQYLRAGAKPRSAWASGLELELIGYEDGSLERIGPQRVREVLERLCPDPADWEREDGAITAASLSYGRITLEPGGQIEFSGLARASLGETARDLDKYLRALGDVAQSLGLLFLAVGFDPLRRLDEQRWISKQRYSVMRPYLESRGARAWDMMTRTASIQTSIDFCDEIDLGKKFTLGNRLGPIVAAMFANSPFAEGRLSGWKSTRYAAWLETDPDRCGVHSSALATEFSLGGFVDRVLATPLIFLQRDGDTVAGAGRRLSDIPGATVADFADLLSTVFTEARIRPGYVEMRSADSGGLEDALACMALWKGLTYDTHALDDALAIAPSLCADGFVRLQTDVARRALQADAEGVDVLNVAREAAALASEALARIAPEEVPYLDPLMQRVEDGVTRADITLRDSGGDVRRALSTWRVG